MKSLDEPHAGCLTEALGRVSFAEALAFQERLVARKRSEPTHDYLLLLEHDPVYTIGRTRNQSSLGGLDALPAPVHVINRGGQATWHGPGQLVGYPIIDLRTRQRDLHAYLRTLENVLVTVLANFGVPALIRPGLTGVWVESRKIASVGVGVRGWVTMHGFALNLGFDLSGFDPIVPCGIADVQMTSVARETGIEPDWEKACRTVSACFWTILNESLPMQAAAEKGHPPFEASRFPR